MSVSRNVRGPVVRCYAECKDGVWQAFSMEYGLAAQGESYADVKAKLEAMVRDYLYDAIYGEDREHQEVLLARKAPLYQRAKYQLYSFLSRLGQLRDGLHVVFSEPQEKLIPAACR